MHHDRTSTHCSCARQPRPTLCRDHHCPDGVRSHACVPTSGWSRRSSTSPSPHFDEVVDRLVAEGIDEIVVVPLLSAEAYHAIGRRPAASSTPRCVATPASRSTPPRCSASSRRSSTCSTSACVRLCPRTAYVSSTHSCSPVPARPTRSPTPRSHGRLVPGAPTTSSRRSPRSRRALPPAAGEAVRTHRADGRRHIAVGSSSSHRASCPTASPSSRIEAGAVAVAEPLGADSRWPGSSWLATPSAPSTSSRSRPPSAEPFSWVRATPSACGRGSHDSPGGSRQEGRLWIPRLALVGVPGIGGNAVARGDREVEGSRARATTRRRGARTWAGSRRHRGDGRIHARPRRTSARHHPRDTGPAAPVTATERLPSSPTGGRRSRAPRAPSSQGRSAVRRRAHAHRALGPGRD